MNALQKPGRIAGLWFIGTFLFSIPAVLLYDPVLNDANYILGQGFDTRISAGALLEILLAIANIATAVVFFPVLKRVNEAVALGYVASRTVESAMIIVGLMSLMSVVTLRDDITGGGGGSASLGFVGRALVALHDWTFLLGPQFCAGFGNGLLLGYLMYRSGLVPRPDGPLGGDRRPAGVRRRRIRSLRGVRAAECTALRVHHHRDHLGGLALDLPHRLGIQAITAPR